MKNERSINARLGAALAFAMLAACAPDPDPISPDNLGINMPDLSDPDMGEPDMERPTEDMDRPTEDMDRPTEDMDRPREDAGADMGMGDDMGEASCDVDCGAGTCINVTGAPNCDCPPGFMGDRCGDCLRGYTGANCDECDDGYQPDPLGSGTCVPDPCAGDPCSGNGTCAPVAGAAPGMIACECATGFAGDACDMCETGYTGVGGACDQCDVGFVMEGGECVIAACSPIPCTDKGTCVDADGDGMSECVCETGWTGRDCGTCAVGYVLDTATGECVVDVCLNIPCDNGTCGPDPTGGPTGICVCDPGYDGAACDACDYGFTEITVGTQTLCLNELPVRDSRVTAWFDAAEASTITVTGSDTVEAWQNRLQPNQLDSAADITGKPRYIGLPQPAVAFDGSDSMFGTSFIGSTDAYAVFLVVTWGPTTNGDVVLDVETPTQSSKGMSIMVWDDIGHFSHRDGDGANGATDTVQHNAYAPDSPQLLIAQRAPFLNGRVMLVSDGATETSIQATEGDLDEDTVTVVGGLGVGLTTRNLDGRIHEIIIVNSSLTLAEREAITAYLEVKWSL